MPETTTSDQIESAQLQRIALLEAMYDLYKLNGGNVYQTLGLPQAGEKAGIKDYKDVWAAASYLSGKGLVEADGGGWTGRMTVRGIDMVEKWRSPSHVNENEHTNQPASIVVHGHVIGGIQSNSPNSTQVIVTTLSKIDESVSKLKELVEKSSIAELDKEETVAALTRLQQLAQKPKSAEVIAKAKEKIEIVRNTIETAAELSKIAVPYIAMLANHFA